jgi:hypothetical protein
LKEIKIVLQSEALNPKGVKLHFEQIVCRLEGDDAHPIERKE